MAVNKTVLQNEFFTAFRLFDNVIAIEGLAGEYCYLVEGDQHALLIDGLTGVGQLKPFVESLTDKPITLVLTHGHLDHSGAAFEFKECFIHPEDMPMLTMAAQTDPGRRLGFCSMESPQVIRRVKPTMEDVIPACLVNMHPAADGDAFYLGGTQLRVIALPGHTRGSIVLLDEDNRAVYSGDACNLNTLVGLAGSATVEEYASALEKFSAHLGRFDALYGGHIDANYGGVIDGSHRGTAIVGLPPAAISDGIELCRAIIKREDDSVEINPANPNMRLAKRRKAGSYATADGSFCNMVYSLERL